MRKFENGSVYVNYSKFLGYTKGTDGNLAIVPEEAELVRRIFRLFLEGNSTDKIAKQLTEEGVPTVTKKTHWHATVIYKMLSNEKYMGDALLQKTYTIDFLTKKKVMNKGIVPQYYVEDNHEPIIPKELFYRVQEEKARRSNLYRPDAKKKSEMVKGKYSSQYVLSDIMICKECGQPYRRKVWSKNDSKKIVWRCDSRLKYGTKKCRNSPTLEEKTLHGAIMEAVNKVVEDGGEFVSAFRENVIRVIGSYSAASEPTEYDEQIEGLQKELLELIEATARDECADEVFDEAYRSIADKIKDLKQQRVKMQREKQLADSFEERLDGMEQYVRKTSYLKRQFDDELVRQLLQMIKVVNGNWIEVQFRSGIVMSQRVDYYD